MHLVYNIYLITAEAGGVDGLVSQVPDIVHAVVGGGVHLGHIQHAALVDAPADLALATGVAVFGRVGAVDGLGKNFGAGGLAGAPGAGEQVGVADMAGAHLVAQGGDDGGLAHHVLKAAGPVFAVKRAVQRPISPFSKHKKTDKPLRCSAYGCRLSAAHRANHLMLLGSPPDMVHGALSHRAHIRMPNSAVRLCPYSTIIIYPGPDCNSFSPAGERRGGPGPEKGTEKPGKIPQKPCARGTALL